MAGDRKSGLIPGPLFEINKNRNRLCSTIRKFVDYLLHLMMFLCAGSHAFQRAVDSKKL